MTLIKTTLTVLFFFFFCNSVFASDPFTVSGINVDARGKTPVKAQVKAIRAGQAKAADILLKRLTLGYGKEGQIKSISEDNAAKMILAIEIGNEKRSSTRYLGNLTVSFNPSAVKAYLNQSGVKMVTSQSRTRLILPLTNGDLVLNNSWYRSWRRSDTANILTPMITLPMYKASNISIKPSDVKDLNFDVFKSIGKQFDVQQLLIANNVNGTAKMIDISLDSQKVKSFYYNANAKDIIDKFQIEWKESAINFAMNKSMISVDVNYSSHSDWLKIKSILNNTSLILNAKLISFANKSAIMEIYHGGGIEGLINELSYKGVSLKADSLSGYFLTLSVVN
jgi:hypothetical protein